MKAFASLALVLASSALVAGEGSEGVSSSFAWSVGADLRIRQEFVNNVPGLPGHATSMMSTRRMAYRNQFRFRPRVWLSAETGPFRLYARVADEFREYPTLHTPRRERAYTFPDELFLDNLYLEGTGLSLFGLEAFDFRIGRQDMLEGHSVFGLDRLIADGTASDGSRNFYSDMARVTLHFDETKKLDLFGVYDFGRNDIRWGNHQSRGRSLNTISASDSNDLDEWGGGAIYSQTAFQGALPFKVYAIFKATTAHDALKPVKRRVSAREITTFGALLNPKLSERWDFEIEAAQQAGRIVDSGEFAGGTMAHLAANYHFDTLRQYRPTLSWATTYYSGDKNRTKEGRSDHTWDPVWGRYTQDSEMLVYGALYENCWWANMVYSKLKFTMTFGPRHALYAYTGPMFAAVQDGLGHADNTGTFFKGILSAVRYDFPLRLAPKGATGLDRFEVVAHVVGELFNPGGYYESDKPAYFLRWQVEFRF